MSYTALEFTGGVPFDIIKPVLERATADQLFMLEHHNPYLVEDTDKLWQFHCNREFRNKQREINIISFDTIQQLDKYPHSFFITNSFWNERKLLTDTTSFHLQSFRL